MIFKFKCNNLSIEFLKYSNLYKDYKFKLIPTLLGFYKNIKGK